MRTSETTTSATDIREQINRLLRELGEVERDITHYETDFEDRRNSLQARYESAIRPLQERRAELNTQIHSLAEANRSTLLADQNTKEVVLAAGKIFWQKVRGGVKFEEDDKDAILAFLAKNHFSSLVVRIERKIMKNLIIKYPRVRDALEEAGLIIVGDGHEKLFVRPLEVKLDTKPQGPNTTLDERPHI